MDFSVLTNRAIDNNNIKLIKQIICANPLIKITHKHIDNINVLRLLVKLDLIYDIHEIFINAVCRNNIEILNYFIHELNYDKSLIRRTMDDIIMGLSAQ